MVQLSTMKYKILYVRGVLLACLGCLTFGCQKGMSNNKTEGVSAFAIYSHSPGATYTIYINGEPAGWGVGTDDYLVRGFPICRGTNQIAIETVFSPEWVSKMPRYYTPTVSIRLCAQETHDANLTSTNWNAIDEINVIRATNEPFVSRWEYNMKNDVVNDGFEELGPNKERYLDQCRSMSVKLAALIQKQDYDSLAKVFGLTNLDSMTSYAVPSNFASVVKTNLLINCSELCPELVYPDYEATNEDILVSGIVDKSEIKVQTGAHLILLYCNNDKHFASFTNRKLADQSSRLKSAPFHHYGTFNIDSFVFGRVQGKWKFMANGCGWIDLNQEMLNNK